MARNIKFGVDNSMARTPTYFIQARVIYSFSGSRILDDECLCKQKMSLDFHQYALAKLCRVCGKLNSVRDSSKQQAENCADYTKELYVCNISVWGDDPSCHPRKVCWKCSRVLRHVKNGTKDPKSCTESLSAAYSWLKHPRTGQCDTCDRYKKLVKGGRPAKTKHSQNSGQNRQTISTVSSVKNLQVAFNLATTKESLLVSHKLSILGKDPQEETLFMCVICQCIIGQPSVQTPCEHNFCSQCLFQWFCFRDSYEVPCPVCRLNVHYNDVAASPRILRCQLSALNTACTDCGTIGKLTAMASHTCPTKQKPAQCHCNICQNPPATPGSSDTPHDPLVQEATQAASVLKRIAAEHKRGTPIPSVIEEATDRWTWLKLHARRGLEARIKTPGRVMLS